MYLSKYQIPYRYEPLLQLGDVDYYPDFMALHPVEKKIYLWEHGGLIDKPSYANNFYEKMKGYASHGFYPTINLITTFETLDNPLTTDVIEETIERYFL